MTGARLAPVASSGISGSTCIVFCQFCQSLFGMRSAIGPPVAANFGVAQFGSGYEQIYQQLAPAGICTSADTDRRATMQREDSEPVNIERAATA